MRRRLKYPVKTSSTIVVVDWISELQRNPKIKERTSLLCSSNRQAHADKLNEKAGLFFLNPQSLIRTRLNILIFKG